MQPVGKLGSLDEFAAGTRFLTQFYNDLATLLDSLLTAAGDQSATTQQIINQIVGRIGAALGPAGQRLVALEVLFLDPVSLQLVDPDGRALKYDLGDAGPPSNQLSGAFVEVGSNVEVVVIPNPVGHYELSVADVQARARGAAVFFGNQTSEVRSLTEALRQRGSQTFSFEFFADVAAASATVPQFAPLIATSTVPADFVRPIVPSLSAVVASVNVFSELLLNSNSLSAGIAIDAQAAVAVVAIRNHRPFELRLCWMNYLAFGTASIGTSSVN